MNSGAKWQKTCLIVLCVVLALILVGLAFATAYVHHMLNQIGRVDSDGDTLSPEDLATATESLDPNYTGPVVDATDITLNTVPDASLPGITDSEEVINILLVGQDRRPGESRQRSDSMILCSFHKRTGTITMTSFMRDTYVYIPGYGKNKMNAAYALGGFHLINETLAVNFGVHVDANIEVDFGNFKSIIDRLGGVRIELTASEAEYINTKLKSQRVSAGWQTLDGEEALWYARNRTNTTLEGANNDFGRTERQRRLLSALITAYKNQSVGDMLDLMYDLLPMVTTNLTNHEILEYATELLPMLSGAQIQTLRIPADSTFDSQYVSGVGACLIPDLEEIRSILAKAGVVG